MSKRAQISSEAIVYIITIVIVGVILIIGYRYISSGKKVVDRGELLQFQNKLASDIKSVGKDYGTFKKITYAIPDRLNEVCLVDLDKKDEIVTSKLIKFYPEIKDSLQSTLRKNLFFVGATDQKSSYIGNISVKHFPYFNCFHQKNNKIEIGIEGLGGGGSKILAEFTTKAKISKESTTILQSVDEAVTIEVPKGTRATASDGTEIKEISIEMKEPTPEETRRGLSDVYILAPKGVKFSPEIELRMKFKGIDCPPNPIPVFVQYDNKGNQKIFKADKVNCEGENWIAIFKIDEFI